MTELVTFGETMVRLSPPDDERIETADEYQVHVAGAESNVAAAASRLGLDATWTSKLPDNPVARRVTGELKRHDVDTRIVWSDEGRQGTYYLEIGDPPRGNDVIYDRKNAAVTTASADELPLDLIREADGFHTTGITPALSDTLEGTTEDVLRAARDGNATTSFDLNYRSKLWSPSEAKPVLESLFPLVDVLVVARRDAETVLGLDGDAETVARELDDAFEFDVTIVTRGSEGALALSGGTVYEQPTFDATSAYPVGTGDSFVAGFLSQYLDGAGVPAALEYGAATAAIKRSIPGDIAVVSPDEVDAVIEGGTAAISR